MTVEIEMTNNILNIETVEAYVEQLLIEKLPTSICFHNLEHTQNVKTEVEKLAQKANLSKETIEILVLTALFHDTGIIEGFEGHEGNSQLIAAKYLRANNYPNEAIEQVKKLIKVTNPTIAPASLLEKIICDADTSHIGQKRYIDNVSKLRQERETLASKTFMDLDWEKENLRFLQQHTFYSKVGRRRYQKRKLKNIKKVKNRIKALKKEIAKKEQNLALNDDRGARMMFKTALRNHIDLTAIADQKANMMLSVNALILTIGMPVFASYLPEKLYLLGPSIVFMLTCVTTMVFATLSTRPIKMDGKTNLSDLNSGKTNLFFFGNFYKIGLNPYQNAIRTLIANQQNFDNSIINDLYYLGLALGDKYRHLRTCYNVFIVGICMSLLAFLIAYTVC